MCVCIIDTGRGKFPQNLSYFHQSPPSNELISTQIQKDDLFILSENSASLPIEEVVSMPYPGVLYVQRSFPLDFNPKTRFNESTVEIIVSALISYLFPSLKQK